MDSQHTHAKPFRFTDPRQQRIHDRLSLLGPGPVDFYRAACRLMAMHPPLEATTHLVGHLLRELESALRAVVRVVAEYTEQPRPRGEPDKHKRDILANCSRQNCSSSVALVRSWRSAHASSATRAASTSFARAAWIPL